MSKNKTKLTKHPKINKNEYAAKLFLEDIFPKQYAELEVRDKPDLVDVENNVGIEVTSALSQKDCETYGLISRLCRDSETEREKDIEKIKKNGCEYNDYIISWNRGHQEMICFLLYKVLIKKLSF